MNANYINYTASHKKTQAQNTCFDNPVAPKPTGFTAVSFGFFGNFSISIAL